MPSKARARFDENSKDVTRLLEIHKDVAGDARGRKWGVEVLNKSGIILVCAFWEAYIEDVATEGLDALINIPDPSKLPLDLKKQIAKGIKSSPNDLSPWDLAGTNWKNSLSSNLASAKQKLIGNWNTPKSHNVRDLFATGLGIPDVTASWTRKWLSADSAKKKLDKFVVLRGEIAHRGKALAKVSKWEPYKFLKHAEELAGLTDDCVNRHVLSVTGLPLF